MRRCAGLPQVQFALFSRLRATSRARNSLDLFDWQTISYIQMSAHMGTLGSQALSLIPESDPVRRLIRCGLAREGSGAAASSEFSAPRNTLLVLIEMLFHTTRCVLHILYYQCTKGVGSEEKNSIRLRTED
jgi:hypothetical protein